LGLRIFQFAKPVFKPGGAEVCGDVAAGFFVDGQAEFPERLPGALLKLCIF
jgi:hypothetical protein